MSRTEKGLLRAKRVGVLIEKKGMSYGEVALYLGISRCSVAGLYYRYRNPPTVATAEKRVQREQSDLWTESRLTEKWVNRKKNRNREHTHYS